MLLAEDEPADQNLVKRSLEGFGCELGIVSNGEELLRYFEQREGGLRPSPDLIMLDLGLPSRRGNEVLVQLRGMIGSWVPIVIFSGSDDLTDIVECYEAGASSYVSKPEDLCEFQAAVAAIAGYWLQLSVLP